MEMINKIIIEGQEEIKEIINKKLIKNIYKNNNNNKIKNRNRNINK